MSTLSELIPSGGTQNNIEFVAQGTLANGQAVALRSDGKVEAISETSASNGTAVQFSTGNYAEEILSFPIPSTNQIVVAYQEAGIDNSFKAVVGTITANAIVFSSSPIAVSGGVAVTWIAGCFETGESKVVFAWTNNSNKLVALGGSVSGTGSSATISLGSASTISTSQISNNVFLQDNPAASGKTQFIYRDQSASSAKVLTLSINSSNTIGTGQATTITSTSYPRGVGPATEDDKSILVDSPNGGNLVLYVGSYNSGNDTWSFNTSSPVALNSGDTFFYNNPVVVANNFIGVAFTNASGYPTVNSFTLSGTTLTAGTPLVLASNGVGRNGFAYDATASKYVFAYRNTSTAAGLYHTIDFSGTAFTTASSGIQFVASTVDVSVAYNASQGKTIFSFSDGGDSEKGKGQVYTLAITNVSSFIGITNAAISSGATGEVAVKGGLSTGGNLLPFVPTAGSPVTVLAGAQYWKAITYDTNSNKIVIAVRDDNASNAGVAFVGTVSGTSISFGSKVTFAASAPAYYSMCFDSSNNKVVIAYRDGNNSNYGTAIVGTVSGTGISFGTAVVFESAATVQTAATFDSTNNKVVIFYEDDANNDYGTAVVGTVSGTSISFGTPVVFDAVNMQLTVGGAAVFDSSSNKAVVFYRNASGYEGYAAVGTVSGTSISFGTPVKFSSGAAELDYINATFDSAANKIVTSYRVNTDSGYGKAIVGTVSGTSISFGSESTFESASTNYISSAFDSSTSQIVFSYQDADNANKGTAITGTVSGTSISFGSSSVFDAGSTSYAVSVFDPDANKTITSYGQTTDGCKAVVIDVTNDLTIGSNYFVQDDGTLATTSSSNKAGKAISTTALNLVDPT